MLQSQLGTFCHQVAGLYERSALSSPTKICMFSYYLQVKFYQICLFGSYANLRQFDVAMKQTSFFITWPVVQENITKPLWYVLPPGGANDCVKKVPVCPYKNACFRNYYKSTNVNKHVLFESSTNRRDYTLGWNRLQGRLNWSLS